MSAEASVWAMGLRGLSPLERLILIYLAEQAAMDGWWRGDRARLADQIEVDILSVHDALRALEGRGVIRTNVTGDVYLSGGDLLAKS